MGTAATVNANNLCTSDATAPACVAGEWGTAATISAEKSCTACAAHCDACTDGTTCTDPSDGYFLTAGAPTAITQCTGEITTAATATTDVECAIATTLPATALISQIAVGVAVAASLVM